jgi:hypothetical protein
MTVLWLLLGRPGVGGLDSLWWCCAGIAGSPRVSRREGRRALVVVVVVVVDVVGVFVAPVSDIASDAYSQM